MISDGKDGPGAGARAERLAEALRANLRRRKAQLRRRAGAAAPRPEISSAMSAEMPIEAVPKGADEDA